METTTLEQYEIEQTLLRHFDYISKLDAIKFIKNIFGSTFNLSLTVKAYNHLIENEWSDK